MECYKLLDKKYCKNQEDEEESIEKHRETIIVYINNNNNNIKLSVATLDLL